MSQSLPVHRTVLAADALGEVLAGAYGLGGPVGCRLLHQGFHDSYRVGAGERTAILRVYRRGRRTLSEVEGEVGLLDRLGDGGLSVGRAIRDRSGAAVRTLPAPEGERLAVLFEAVPGNLPLVVDESVARSMGDFLGRAHAILDEAGEDLDRPALDLEAMFDRPLEVVERAFPDEGDGLDRLEALVERVRRGLEDLGRDPAAFGLCHGDLIQTNVHVDSTGRLSVFDFDHAVRTWRAYDVAVFLWSLPEADRERAGGAFLEAYRRHAPFEDEVRRRVPAFQFARQLLVWSWHIEEASDFRAVNPHRFRHELGRLQAFASSIAPAGRRLSLRAIVEEVDLAGFAGDIPVFLDRETGRIVGDRPDLDLEDLGEAVDFEGPEWIELPDRWDIDSYRLLEEFVESIADEPLRSRLARAIRGKGAFARAREIFREAGILERWDEHESNGIARVVRRWLEDHDVPFEDDV